MKIIFETISIHEEKIIFKLISFDFDSNFWKDINFSTKKSINLSAIARITDNKYKNKFFLYLYLLYVSHG